MTGTGTDGRVGRVGRAAVVGAGVIGRAWVTTFLARGVEVVVSDPDPGVRQHVHEAVAAHWPVVVALGGPAEPDLGLLSFEDDPAEAAGGADLVQESGPEVLATKARLFARLDAAAPEHAVLASSSSGLLASQFAAGCRHHPERVLVGHPFHPVHLVPLVEVVPGPATSPDAVERAMAVYAWLGKKPVHVRRELPGHVTNRLQAALWREAYWLVESGAATVEDVDTAIANGPGLRWAAVGPFVAQHLSGGPGGLRRTLAHLGPPMAAWWETFETPPFTPELVERLATGVDAELGGRSDAEVEAARDRVVLALLAAKQHEKGLPA